MQRLLAAALLLAPVGALSTEIIGFDGKEQYSYWNHKAHQHKRKIYDPVAHKTRFLNFLDRDSHKEFGIQPAVISDFAKMEKDTDTFVKATAVAQKKPINFENPENATATDVAKHMDKVIDKEFDDKDITKKEAKAIDKAQEVIHQEAQKIKEAKEDAKESARVAKEMAEEAREAQELKEAEKAQDVQAAPVSADAASIDAIKTMDEAGGASEQGFSGPNVQHNDMKTATGDWQAEYGRAQTGLRSHAKICDLYPDNEWCQKNVKKAKSAAAMPASTLAALIALCSGLAGLL